MALELTVNEIIETLKRSSLVTVLVEGSDDVLIYRWIEEEIGIHNASFLPCGGRNNLLQIFDRRSEFPNSAVIYVADQDSFLYSNIPDRYSEIIWTNGYSIENDLYHGRQIESILSKSESEVFIKSLNSFVEYYAFEVDRLLSGDQSINLNIHPQQAICDLTHTVKQAFLEERGFIKPADEIYNRILDNYDVMLRGKSLFALLTRIVSNGKRAIKHSKNSLLEHCYRTHKSEMFMDLLNRINQRISA